MKVKVSENQEQKPITRINYCRSSQSISLTAVHFQTNMRQILRCGFVSLPPRGWNSRQSPEMRQLTLNILAQDLGICYYAEMRQLTLNILAQDFGICYYAVT